MICRLLLLLGLLATPLLAKLYTTDYCDPNLCPTGRTHIGCNNTGEFFPDCEGTAQIQELNSKTICSILDLHNQLRNNVAGGNFGQFPTATRMSKMRWLPELAELARLHVMQCRRDPDNCRNLDILPHVGQLNGYNSWFSKPIPAANVVFSTIKRWSSKAQGHDFSAVIHSYALPENTRNYTYMHLTQMLQEAATHVGCAVLRQTQNRHIHQFLTCNYAKGNQAGIRVYETGPTASGCLTGRDKRYPNLCSVKELYNWGDWENVELVMEKEL